MNAQQEEYLRTLTEIRSLMAKSSRFISLSGWSGIMAGVCALIGASIAYYYLHIMGYSASGFTSEAKQDLIIFFFADASLVLLSALLLSVYFTIRNAKRKGLSYWDATAKQMIVNLAIPLAAGGLFCFALLYNQLLGLIAPSMLVFYGLALINASRYTLDDIRYLGMLEVALGLIASFWMGYGLFFWVLGFGVLHIVYGVSMYWKYERTA